MPDSRALPRSTSAGDVSDGPQAALLPNGSGRDPIPQSVVASGQNGRRSATPTSSRTSGASGSPSSPSPSPSPHTIDLDDDAQSSVPNLTRHTSGESLPLTPLPNPDTSLPSPPLTGHTHICCVPAHNSTGGMHPAISHLNPSQPIYVLAADGSQLYLVDPSVPPRNEEPPPYLSFTSHAATAVTTASTGPSHGGVPDALALVPEHPELGPEHPDLNRHRAATVSGALIRPPALAPGTRARSTPSSPLRPFLPSPHYQPRVDVDADETTPLLGTDGCGASTSTRLWPAWRWGDIWCGWRREGSPGREGYFAPMADRGHWTALAHLLFINLPFNLLLWPVLLVGTLAGIALLITLPLGAVVWWFTLILARWGAKQERRLQTYYHGANFGPPRRVFHYVVEVRSQSPESGDGPPVIVVERRFVKCSWAMLSDYYSYSALSYFLLIKPIVVLFSTLVLIVLFPVALVLLPLFPIYLRAARVWGRYQAHVAMENV